MGAGSDVPPTQARDADVSFSHLFALTRERSISLDQDGRHSRNDHRVVSLNLDDTVLERTSDNRRPEPLDLFTQHARERDSRFERAFPNRQTTAPAPDPVGTRRAMHRGFNQCPPQPRRAAAGDPPIADATGARVHPWNEPGIAGQVPRGRKAADVGDLGADHQREHWPDAPQLLQRDGDRIAVACGADLRLGLRRFRADDPEHLAQAGHAGRCPWGQAQLLEPAVVAGFGEAPRIGDPLAEQHRAQPIDQRRPDLD